MPRPVLIVGDVQGDVERLHQALAPYPDDDLETIFLGDFFQGGAPGAAGGAAAARLARARRNSRAILGNHDLMLLGVLQERRDGWRPPMPGSDGAERMPPGRLHDVWLSRRGDEADLDAVAADGELESWLRGLPLMLMLDDRTLVQHCDGDTQQRLGRDVDEVNARVHELMRDRDGVWRVFRHTVARGAFADEDVLDRHLAHFGARRLVHGHTPHRGDRPKVSHGGRVWSFDGCFSRYWEGDGGATAGPIEATVGLLPPLDDAVAAR